MLYHVLSFMMTLLVFTLTTSASEAGFKPLYRTYPFQATTSTSKGELTAFSITSQFMEGDYRQGGLGIHFKSVGSETGNFIAITSTSTRKNIFSSTQVDGNTFRVSIMGGDYLVTKDQSEVDKEEKSTVNAYQSKNQKETNPRLMKMGPKQYFFRRGYPQYLDLDQSQSDIHQLLQSQEAKLIIQAALELGSRGYYGRDSTALMPFYVLAMRLAQMQSPSITSSDFASHCQQQDDINSSSSSSMTEEERLFSSKGLTQCKNTGRYCELDDGCPWGEECVGMCGVGCQCWSMVCGDCCLHRGCLGFSQGCSNCRNTVDASISLNCFLVLGFNCDVEYTC